MQVVSVCRGGGSVVRPLFASVESVACVVSVNEQTFLIHSGLLGWQTSVAAAGDAQMWRQLVMRKCVGLAQPEPYIYTVFDRIFGDLPAQNTGCTLYIYGPGQPYNCGSW